MTAPIIKAIETRYNGYRFRSRLEARWAVFFDAMSEPWLYEPEGFALPTRWYLPDFYLPVAGFYAEIKPAPSVSLETHAELDGIGADMALAGKPLMIIAGNPWPGEFQVRTYYKMYTCPVLYHESPPVPVDASVWELCSRFLALYPEDGPCPDVNIIDDAFRAARGARFEHGESGA